MSKLVGEIRTGKFQMRGQLEDQANGRVDIEDFVYQGGEVIPASQAEISEDQGIHTARERNYASGYWYERDKDLYQFERECYMQFMREYKHPRR